MINFQKLTVLCLLFFTHVLHAETYTLATLNCEFLNTRKVHIKFGKSFDFKDWSEEEREAKFIEACAAIGQEIKRINADVIVLTEVGNEADIKELLKYAQYPHYEVCDSKDTSTGQHVAIFSRLPMNGVIDMIPGREGYLTESDDPDSEKDTGLSKGMRVTLNIKGQNVHIYGVHLKSERGYSEADNQRIAQASLIRRHYLPYIKKGEHVIVVGDLNDKRGDPTLKRIRGLDDIHEDLVQLGHVKYWAKDQLDARWTYIYQGQRNQIDHILPSRDLSKFAKMRIHVPTTKLGEELVTDHRGLIVEFNVPDSD